MVLLALIGILAAVVLDDPGPTGRSRTTVTDPSTTARTPEAAWKVSAGGPTQGGSTWM